MTGIFDSERQALQMFTQETRHDVVQALKDSEPLSCDELRAVTGTSDKQLSVALTLLSDAGAIEERDGGYVYIGDF